MFVCVCLIYDKMPFTFFKRRIFFCTHIRFASDIINRSYIVYSFSSVQLTCIIIERASRSGIVLCCFR